MAGQTAHYQRTALGREINELVSPGSGLAKQAANKDEVSGNLVDLFSAGGAQMTSLLQPE